MQNMCSQSVWCNGSLHHTLSLGRDLHSVSFFIALQTSKHITLTFCWDAPSVRA